jgi:hypothetical protein
MHQSPDDDRMDSLYARVEALAGRSAWWNVMTDHLMQQVEPSLIFQHSGGLLAYLVPAGPM